MLCKALGKIGLAVESGSEGNICNAAGICLQQLHGMLQPYSADERRCREAGQHFELAVKLGPAQEHFFTQIIY